MDPRCYELKSLGWTKEQLLYMSDTRELDRVPKTK